MRFMNLIVAIFISLILSGCYRYCDKNSITGTGFYLVKYDNELAGLVKQEIIDYSGPIKGNTEAVYKARIENYLNTKFANKTTNYQLEALKKIGFQCTDNKCSTSINYLYEGRCSFGDDKQSLHMTDTIKIELQDHQKPEVEFFRYKPDGLVFYDVNY